MLASMYGYFWLDTNLSSATKQVWHWDAGNITSIANFVVVHKPPKNWRWFGIFRSACESIVKLVSPPLLIIRPLQLMVAAMQRRRHKRKRAVQRLNRT